MRFLILTPQTYPEYSGSGLNALKFASHLVKSGHSACILTLNQNKKYPTQEQAQNVNIQRITYFNRNIFIKLMSGPGLLFNYIKYISKSDILMIYGAQMHAYQLSIIIAKILGKKVVFRSTLMDTDDVRTLIKYSFSLTKYALSKIDIYYSLNVEFKRRFIEIFGNSMKIVEISPGVDETYFSPTKKVHKDIRVELNIDSKCCMLLCVGYLIKRKGYQSLFNHLSTLKLNYKLVIIGDNDISRNHFLSQMRNEMFELKSQGLKILKDRIIFVRASHDIFPYFKAADIVLINSKVEGVPNVLLEAMSCAKPIICSWFKGLDTNIIRNGYNALVYHSPDHIPELIQQFMESKELRNKLGCNARNMIKSDHAFSIIAEKLITALMLDSEK